MIDLHTHSTASDGDLSPSALVQYAAQKNISVLSLTDHDTLSGLKEAKEQAQKNEITFIDGIELNIEWKTGEFHLLGYGINTECTDLLKLIEKLQEGRKKRNEQIITTMQKDGLDVRLDELVALAGTECIGRPHIARYLCEKQITKTPQKAFDLYLGKNRKYFVERYGSPLEHAIKAIKKAGGVAIIAHPLSLYVSWGKMEATIAELVAKGIQGLEAWHPAARISESQRLENIAKQHQIITTAGSDFHGESVRKDRKIGHTAGDTSIEDRFWNDELKKLLYS
ncbi:MAG: PHP domain-containing protein [Treponemataceae bacterium]